MSTLQLRQRFLVRDLAAIVKQLSRKQKDRLYDMIWDDLHEMTEEEKRIIDKKFKEDQENPKPLIPWEEVKKKWEDRR